MKRDGAIDHCPVCRAALSAPIRSHGETHCPRCEAQLWHMAFPSGPAFFVRRPGENIYDVMAATAEPSHGLTPEILQPAFKDADAFDIAEIFADLENALSAKGN